MTQSSVCSRFLKLLILISIPAATTAGPVLKPLPRGEGELPRVSALLWDDVGTNRGLGLPAVTVSLTAKGAPGAHGDIAVYVVFHRDSFDLELYSKQESGLFRGPLPQDAESTAVDQLLRSLEPPAAWWVDSRGPDTLLSLWTKPRPTVALGLRSWWVQGAAGHLPRLGLELVRRVKSVIRKEIIEGLSKKWQRLVDEAGLTSPTAHFVIPLKTPGFTTAIVWDGDRYPSPRLRSYRSRNAPGLKPGGFTIQTKNATDRSESQTFLMPYGITVTGPPGEVSKTFVWIKRVLSKVFYRSPQ